MIDSVLLPKADSKQTSAARDMIELAIRHGVPMYNAGDAKGCAAVYEVAAHGVMALAKNDMTHASSTRMTMLMNRAENTHNMSDRAWMLRQALDAAHTSLTN